MDFDTIVTSIGKLLLKLNIFKKNLPQEITPIQTDDVIIELICKKGIHIYPRHHSYRNGFTKTTMCEVCNSIGLYEDQHPIRPCNNCGGEVIESNPGKFDYSVKRWFLKHN